MHERTAHSFGRRLFGRRNRPRRRYRNRNNLSKSLLALILCAIAGVIALSVIVSLISAIPDWLVSGEAQEASETVVRAGSNALVAFAGTTIGGLLLVGGLLWWWFFGD